MIKLFKNFTKKDVFLIIICVILISLQVYLDLKIPDYMKEITTLVQTTGTKIGDVLLQGVYMLICAFGSLLSAVFVGYLSSLISATFLKMLEKNYLKKFKVLVWKRLNYFPLVV